MARTKPTAVNKMLFFGPHTQSDYTLLRFEPWNGDKAPMVQTGWGDRI